MGRANAMCLLLVMSERIEVMLFFGRLKPVGRPNGHRQWHVPKMRYNVRMVLGYRETRQRIANFHLVQMRKNNGQPKIMSRDKDTRHLVLSSGQRQTINQ